MFDRGDFTPDEPLIHGSKRFQFGHTNSPKHKKVCVMLSTQQRSRDYKGGEYTFNTTILGLFIDHKKNVFTETLPALQDLALLDHQWISLQSRMGAVRLRVQTADRNNK